MSENCDYCGVMLDWNDGVLNRHDRLVCKDGDACDRRDEDRNAKYRQELLRRQRGGEELTEAEREATS